MITLSKLTQEKAMHFGNIRQTINSALVFNETSVIIYISSEESAELKKVSRDMSLEIGEVIKELKFTFITITEVSVEEINDNHKIKIYWKPKDFISQVTIQVPATYLIYRDEKETIKEIVFNSFCIKSKFIGTKATDQEIFQFYQEKANKGK